MAKIRKKLLFLSFFGLFLIAADTTVFADSKDSSTVSGEIVAGEFSLSQPNDVNFKVQLDGKKQVVTLEDIQFKIKDYRGIEDGWQVVVKSSNYATYKNNYTLNINQHNISDNTIVVDQSEKQTMEKVSKLATKAEISADAKAGSYRADLEWNLQPIIKNSIKE